MHTTKQVLKWKRFILLTFSTCILFSCQKNIDKEAKPGNEQLAQLKDAVEGSGHLKQTKTFASDAVVSWINLQLQMLKVPLPAGTAGQATDRCEAYCGIALYEAVVPGMPAYQTLSGQLTDFPAMPSAEPGKAYHWAASANAALAEMNRRLFPATADANKTAMTNLENAWQATYAGETDAATLQRSIAFGKEVAIRVFKWAATDGSANVNPPYVPPVGLGLWVPTAATPPVGAYNYQLRKLVPGVANGTELAPPPPFSTTPGSPFWNMVKEVYDATLSLTANQKAMADYFKDVPGYTPGGTYIALLSQALDLAKPTLDMAALTCVKVGLAGHEAGIILFTNKYIFNQIRPVTYIRAYIDPNWSTYIPTPNHPEFPSGHSTTGGAILAMMSKIFGENFHFTLHTYDYLNYPSRSYTSFTQLSNEISDSRFYGGLHYRATLEKSTEQGKKVAENILNTIKFLKE
ncbi:MAG: superfamily protein [Ferruginibacter sp.]|uniref:vanadium-dependent haloperoxidase n=1 Tax=Ferruginibacter sp. TaxID=1940288 RepID=UPI00265A1F6D|nr:vanadium-dependent haloperoxidase [Ferruginibacter sp.]MDB5278032.1 superfamily protein [Ferruginibacter sp.]